MCHCPGMTILKPQETILSPTYVNITVKLIQYRNYSLGKGPELAALGPYYSKLQFLYNQFLFHLGIFNKQSNISTA